ncbi:hypothetical protein EKO04_005276 [Ascochyta lentis]|uniref:Uncharacterized protein n=1 Tax=Ascochyta lentis TaxID=205686 RepID=A0A8H7MK02_9PLEO|nr:hypothetical protein EKO04_005276 [Ascochyta lentis]
MDSQSSSPSGIGRALQQLNDKLEANSHVETGETRRAAEETPDISAKSIGIPKRRGTTPTFNNDLRDFCTGQPPRHSFLAPGGRTPPRFRMSRRSTLADKPELDSLLKAVTITYRGEEFLPLNNSTVHRLSQYLNGSKPLAQTCLFTRLMITNEANKVCADRFVAALEQIGAYCEKLAIVAPFHAIESGNVFAREIDTLESSSDWEKILQCFPNLQTVIFEHPAEESTNLTRDTFYALNCALANITTLQKIEKVKLHVPPRVIFDYHRDYHDGQRQPRGASSHSLSAMSSPLTIVGPDMVYADGVEDFGHLDDDAVFGKIDAVERANL